MNARILCTIALALLVASCDLSTLSNENLPPQKLTWVAKDYSGGVQCSSHNYEPPDIENVLEENGIAVYAVEIRHQPTCAACGCPDYAATHFAQIKWVQLDEARRLGFRQKQPPEE